MEKITIDPPSTFLAILERSRIYNPEAYRGDDLPPQYFPFPKTSWLQMRRQLLQENDSLSRNTDNAE